MTAHLRIATKESATTSIIQLPGVRLQNEACLRVMLENRVASNSTCQCLDGLDDLFFDLPTTR